MTKVQSNVILVLHNLKMVSSNVRNIYIYIYMRTTEFGKNTIIFDVDTT